MFADDYFTYLERQQDDSPLYLFDHQFVEHTPALAVDYTTPSVFPRPAACAAVRTDSEQECLQPIMKQTTDLFDLLGSSRPNFRWLILGPKRSGSTFHVDPNGTSAWNACICGRKLWCAADSLPAAVALGSPPCH